MARAGVTKRSQLESTIDLLESGMAATVGLVLNDVEIRSRDDNYGYYSDYTTQEHSTQSADSRPRRRSVPSIRSSTGSS